MGTDIRNYFVKFVKGKSYGFFVTLGAVVLSLVTTIVYAALYKSNVRFMSWAAFAIVIVGCVAALAFAFVPKLAEYSPVPLALADFVALLLFVKVIYNYVIVVMTGIDLTTFEPRFVACTVLFAISFVAGVVCIFLRQVKEEE